MTDEVIHWSQAELLAEARARFGDDPKRWAFRLVTVPDGKEVGSFRLAPAPAGHIEERQDAQDH